MELFLQKQQWERKEGRGVGWGDPEAQPCVLALSCPHNLFKKALGYSDSFSNSMDHVVRIMQLWDHSISLKFQNNVTLNYVN